MNDKNIKKLRPLTAMQLDTLASIYYGEVLITQSQPQYLGVTRRLWIMLDADGVDIAGRTVSLRRRKLIKWMRWPDPVNQEMVQVVVCTPAGVEEMEAIDA